jgi:Na+/melibiose symporter-like transporter
MLLFIAPNISTTGKMIYASITYIAWGMIYTRFGRSVLEPAEPHDPECG